MQIFNIKKKKKKKKPSTSAEEDARRIQEDAVALLHFIILGKTDSSKGFRVF